MSTPRPPPRLLASKGTFCWKMTDQKRASNASSGLWEYREDALVYY